MLWVKKTQARPLPSILLDVFRSILALFSSKLSCRICLTRCVRGRTKSAELCKLPRYAKLIFSTDYWNLKYVLRGHYEYEVCRRLYEFTSIRFLDIRDSRSKFS